MPLLRKPAAVPVVALLLLLIWRADARSVDQTLIQAGASWKFNDTGTNLSTGWRAPGYDDSAWASGAAQLGYGDSDESTVISYGTSTTARHITYYFRHSFTVASPAAFETLTARLVRDDGAVVYLNGVEIARSNMPTGTITATTLASSAVSGTAESQWFDVPVDPSLLVSGTNVMAVEVHQSSASSSDVSFDFELVAAETQVPLPAVALVSPANGTISNQTNVTFTANVTAPAGLASAALYIGGPPNTATFSGPAQIEDAQISADTPTTANGTSVDINVDSLSPHVHGLMRFPTLIGGGAGQVPAGAIINSATLQVNCTNTGAIMSLYRLTESWVEDEATWNQRQTGVAWGALGADGPASNSGVALGGNCSSTGTQNINITRFVQDWSDGAANHGIVFTDTGTDGVDFSSSESANSPVLTVIYKDSLVLVATEALSGAAATASFPATMSQAGTWYWNVQVTDVNGAQAWGGSDYEFTYDPLVPDAPVLVSPVNGSTGVSPATPLQVTVGNPAGGQLTVSASIRRAAEPEFTVIALPDTQHYSEAFPAIFTSQTQWIKDNKAARNIVFVTHEGDIVQNAGSVPEWQAANASMSILDGVVPYGMAPGNHDEPSANYNIYFPWTRYDGLPWYGGHYQTLNDNNYQFFSGGGLDFVIVHLDFCPTTAVVAWGNGILNSFPNRIGMMTTHAYLNTSAQRTTHVCGSTQYLWDGLVPTTPNLHFMLSGHVHGEGRRTDMAHGHPVYQMLADYQDRSSGGEGWLRILRFVPADDRVYVQTYSPWLNAFESDADSEFTLDFPMAGAFASAGTTAVPSGETASLSPADLLANTEYEWQVTVTNAQGKTQTSPVWRFTTGDNPPVNAAPVAVPDAYSMHTGNILSMDAPGVLGNDTDAEGATLLGELLAAPANGTLGFRANGQFVYTPASGYVGPDSFTYRVTDGPNWSAPATVSLTVEPPPVITVISADFNAAADSFTYQDNTFRNTRQSAYASSERVPRGGFTGGALRISIGGVNNNAVRNMSGGWQRTFTLQAPAAVTLSFRYNLNQGPDYENDEVSQFLASINGVLLSDGPGDWIAQVRGNGNGGRDVTTGWRHFQRNLGLLPAGTHTLTLGGFNNKKNSSSERTTILIDDVKIVRK